MSGQAVTFRRINGRVVPISSARLSSQERKTKAAKGAALVGAGAATGVGAGVTAADLAKKSYKFTVKARNDFKAGTRAMRAASMPGQMSFADKINLNKATKQVSNAVKLRTEAASLFRTRNMVLGVGIAASTALLGAGFHHIKEAASGKKGLDSTDAKLASAAGTAGAVTATATYYSRLNVGSLARVLTNTVARMSGKRRPFKASWWKG